MAGCVINRASLAIFITLATTSVDLQWLSTILTRTGTLLLEGLIERQLVKLAFGVPTAMPSIQSTSVLISSFRRPMRQWSTSRGRRCRVTTAHSFNYLDNECMNLDIPCPFAHAEEIVGASNFGDKQNEAAYFF